MPIALITGPAIPDIFLSINALFFLIFSLKKKLWKYYKNPIFFGFIIFCLYGFIRSIFSEFPIESLTNGGSLFYFRYVFFSLAVWYLLDNNPYLSDCLLVIVLSCILVVSIDACYQYFVGVNLFGNEKFSDTRLTSFFGDEPIVGRYISYLSIFAFFLIYQVTKVDKKIFLISILLLVVCEIVVFLSGERAPLFNIFLFSIFILFFLPFFKIYRIMGVIISITLIVAVAQLNPISKKRMFEQTFSEMKETHFPFLPYTELHEQHYVGALKMFLDKPIMGVGTNLFRYQCQKDKYRYKDKSCTSHPHHFYLQLLAELGIIGFLFLFIFYLYISYLIVRQFFAILFFKSNNAIKFNYFLILIIMFINFWPLIPNMSFYNNWNNVFIFIPMGYLLKFLYDKKFKLN